jgi:hypothetical protein
MNKILISIFLLSSFLFAQSDFEYNLAKFKGNKIVLFGGQGAEDMGKWKQVLNSDAIYLHAFALLNRSSFKPASSNLDGAYGTYGIAESDMPAFERWIRQKYGLSAPARWLALGSENNAIVSGVQTPSATEFDQMLEQRGIKNPLMQVRDFLRENPDHLDAMADLLKQARNRALHLMPAGQTEDLDEETDLLTWAILASETDRVFSGSWVGIELSFFNPVIETPEQYSKLMKNVFRKHIGKIEAEIILQPHISHLWNIWAWMASSLPDYNWSPFIHSLEPFDFPTPLFYTSPADRVCVWIVRQARAKKDWETVIKFAKIARGFTSYVEGDTGLVLEWLPGGLSASTGGEVTKVAEGYPGKSAYAPHIEALLTLGRIDEANKVYDEMIRFERESNRSSNAKLAADVARSLGMESIAKTWEQGELINKAPYFSSPQRGISSFYIYAISQSDYRTRFSNMYMKLSSSSRIGTVSQYNEMRDVDSLGWKKEDENK